MKTALLIITLLLCASAVSAQTKTLTIKARDLSSLPTASGVVTPTGDSCKPLKKFDFFRSFGPATIILTSVCSAGQSADIISSTGHEGNSFLRGSDGRMNRSRAIPLKLGLCLAPLAFESHVSRRTRIVIRLAQVGIGALGFYDAARNLKVNR